ncbi:MAG: peptide chain release factor N(5)-glutamine methyltransferase [Alphaproteobacteria bacterium]|nr:peptide chain release factor N(5)-glutamine methyltransferase [Alphaproteobacteria bacterium]
MTLKEWRRVIEEALSKASIDNVHQEAKWLLTGALGYESSFIVLKPTYTPSETEINKIKVWLARRLQGEPLSRIKGVREFWSLPFQLNEHTLDPRPESEVLVEGVLKWIDNGPLDPWRILDLGTGSGCLLISLLHELPHATGMGIDLIDGALSIAQFNAALNKIESRARFQKGNWGETLEGQFDIIICNPPYIPLRDKDRLEKNVLQFDPSLALFGGEDGLDCYRILSKDIKRLLSPNGIAVLEMGYGQRNEIESLFKSAGYEILFILKDLAGIERGIGVK